MSGPRIDGTITLPLGTPASSATQRLKGSEQTAGKEFVKHLPAEDQQAIQDVESDSRKPQADGEESIDVRDRPWFKYLRVDDQQAILASQQAAWDEIAEPDEVSRSEQIREELEYHPSGQQALDRLVESFSFRALGKPQQLEILEEFRRAPNAANALRGSASNVPSHPATPSMPSCCGSAG